MAANQLKDMLKTIFCSELQIEGTGRTFAHIPLWVAVAAGVASIKLAILTAVIVVALGMQVRVQKAV